LDHRSNDAVPESFNPARHKGKRVQDGQGIALACLFRHDTSLGQGIMMRRWTAAALTLLMISAPSWANIGRVKTIDGAPTVTRGEERIAAIPGTILMQGDVIATLARGRVGITFVDNTRIVLGPNSRVVIEKFDFNDTLQNGSFIARVERGEVAIYSGSIAKSGSKAMLVRTPTSLYAVRNARFVVSVK
jgi:FecR protein